MNQHPANHRQAVVRAFARGAACLLLGGVTAFAQNAAPAAPASESESTTKLEAFSVTGSRIKRIDAETPQPVVRITESDFKATGFSTLGDALRAIPAVAGQSLVATDGGTSFTPGTSSFNLRGLGNNNTLVLINGRRAAPYASAGFNGFQTVFDFNSIPTAAVESIEVLKDGASAIYGSDAVAGVVNVTLKKNYTGLTTEFSYGNTFRTDSNEKSFFAIFGAQGTRSSIVTTVDYQQRASIYGRDLSYTDESDGTPYGGVDQRSTSPVIAGVRGLTGFPQFANGRATFNTPQRTPTVGAAVNATPLYNFQEDAGFTPDTRSFGFYTRGTYELTDLVTAFAEVSFRRSETLIDSAPTPYVTSQELGDAPDGTGIFPAHNPYNPFGQAIRDLRWRMRELGNRTQDVTADSPRLVLGLEGKLPGTEWSWDGAVLYSKNTIEHLSVATSDRLVQNAFNGVLINGVMKYANPFGPNDPDIINYLRFINPNHDEFEVRAADASISGPIFSLPAGEVGLAAGAEIRTERMKNIGTLLNRDGQIVGGSQASDTFGDRRLHSLYAEVSVPVFKSATAGSLELQGALRYEDYSDFGETTKPKLAVVYRPIPEIMLRGSYGESFLAPNLAFLYTSQSTSFTAQALPDPLRPTDPNVQIRQVGGGNPNLQPEETEVYYGGVVLQPFARRGQPLFRDLSFGVEYFQFEQNNLINRLTANNILSNLGAFGHLVVRNPALPGDTVGTISHVLTTWQNLSQGEYKGYDFNVRWVLPKHERFGQFRFDVSATYIHSQAATSATGALVDLDANWGFPQWRGTTTLAWSKGDWSSSVYVNYIGEYSTLGSGFTGLPDVGEQWVVSPQIAYRGFAKSTITVGIRNVFDRNPPVDPSDSKLVNENVNYVEPLFAYVRWSKDW